MVDTDDAQQAWIQDPDYCAIVNFNKITLTRHRIGYLDDRFSSHVIYPQYPNRCDSQFQAICMTGEYQTTTPAPTTTTDYVYY